MATPKNPSKFLLRLGEIEFSAIQGPTGWEESESSALPEHSVINEKSKLQFLGTDLIQLRLTLKLSAMLTRSPVELMLNRLRFAQREGLPMPLVLGAGFYKGTFVISELSHRPGKMLPDGRLVWAEVIVLLKEYVQPTNLEISFADAPAVIKKGGGKPIQMKMPWSGK